MVGKTVLTLEDWKAVRGWRGKIACDTETAHDEVLLGVSLSPENRGESEVDAVYIPIRHWDGNRFSEVASPEVVDQLVPFLTSRELVGFNYAYDKDWIEKSFRVLTNWVACARLMYHLQAAPAGPAPYGLDEMEVEILGWEKSHKEAFHAHLRQRGAKPLRGEKIGKYTWMADLSEMSHYACMDAFGTMEGYKKMSPFFDKFNYWDFLKLEMEYQLLVEQSKYGVRMNVEGMRKIDARLTRKKEAALRRFTKLLSSEIAEIEDAWKDRKIAEYKREYNKSRYANHPEEWERFNPNSDKHKRELFYDKIGLPVLETTEGGKAAVTEDSLRGALRTPVDGRIRRAIEAYLTYEKANTLTTNFTSLYLRHEKNGRLYTRYNLCGTVSGRLAGYKPHLLNAPFSEKAVLRNFLCDEGWGGVHADWTAVEPTLTAHYTEDPTLLKVFRHGLGDIYLDLALELFPNDKELQSGYDPRVPITSAVKVRFAIQRSIAKTVQLAVQYTGTGLTVAANLNRAGIPTTRAEADVLVRRYWKKFRRVAEFQYKLRCLYKEQGYLKNAIGRVIRVPNPEYKDLFSRFIQSGGHGINILFVRAIYRRCRESNVHIRPVLIDCHDSTSNQCPLEQLPLLKKIYKDAEKEVNDTLRLAVPVKMEMKTFSTLAGLKAEE